MASNSRHSFDPRLPSPRTSAQLESPTLRLSDNQHHNSLLQQIFDGMPDVLRDFFKKAFHSKFKCPWIDSNDAGQQLIAGERWQLNLNQQQQKLLASGDTHYWDQATFFHVLLHSSHCLLADKVFLSNDCQLQCILERNSNFVFSKNAELNFKSLLGTGDMIILDLGKESLESSVTVVQKEGFYIAHAYCSSTSISEFQKDITAELYLCKSEWSTIFGLSKVKAHAMDYGCIEVIKNAYVIMGAEQSKINELEATSGGKQNGTLQTEKQPMEIPGIERIAKLKPSDFTGEIKYYTKLHHPGTRQWILDEIYKWKSSDSDMRAKVCLITGDPGMGKSVLAAKLCALEEKQHLLAGCFFFQHQKKRRNNPEKLVHTLAYQFSNSIPNYLDMIIDQVNDNDFTSMNTSELFTVLILEPLHKLAENQQHMSVVIDAVDECDFEFRNDLLKLVIREFTKLPSWLNVIITTRSDQKVLQKLKRLKPQFQLNPTDSRNIADIKMYLSDILREKMISEEFDDGVDLLVTKSEGMFLYFHYVSEAILSCSGLTLPELRSLLPDGIDDYYEINFRRIYKKLGKNKFFTLLQAVIAARTDFPQSLIGPLLKADESETAQVVSVISDILPVQERHIHVFHKSVRDWVTDVELAEDLLVKPSLGHNDVARLCYQKFQDIKRVSHSPSEIFLDPSCRYAIENIIYHFCNATDEDLEDDFHSVLFDLRYMYYRLQLSQESAKDLLDDYEEARKVNDQLSSEIDICFAFVRRNAEHLASMPHLVYQCSLNEPEQVASKLKVQSYSPNLLSSFPELTLYFELINKPRSIAPTLTKCTCDDEISALEIVPNSQNVVCSDVSGSIYIWNKRSAEQVHKEKIEGYNVLYPINECSTTPDGKYICYGDLSQALTPEGSTITLISNANTSANTCCFSPCGEYILAWSYYGEGIFNLFKAMDIKNFQSDYVVELWKINRAVCIKLEHHANREIRPISACFSHDSSLVICGHKDGRMTIWETKTGMQKAVLYTDGTVIKQASGSSKFSRRPPNDPIYALSYSPNGHYLAVCCGKGILLWDAPALSLILKLPCTSTEIWDATSRTCSFSPNSKKLAAGFSNGYIYAWDLHVAAENPYPLKIATKPTGSSNCIQKCAFDDDLNIICAIGNNLCVYSFDSLQNASTPSQATTAKHPKNAAYSVCIPNSGLALTSGNSTICAWEVCTGKLVITSELPGSSHLMVMSEDLLTVFGEPYNIHILEKDTLKFKKTICHCSYDNYENDDDAPAGISHCAISKNGMIAYGTGDGLLYVCYGNNYTSTKTLYAHEGCVTYIQFFPHGQAFISADDDGTVIKWEIICGKETKLEVNEVRMAGHNDSVEQILISQSGIYPQRVVTCSSDKSVHLYDGQSCDLIKKLEGHSSAVLKIALSGDGKLIASGDSQGYIILWDSFTGHLLRCMSYKATNIILDLYFIKNDKYLCARGSNMNALIAYSVDKGIAVSVLSFTSLIMTSSGSSISHTSDTLNNDTVLCGLADETVRFVKICEVQEGSVAETVTTNKKRAENKESKIDRPTLSSLTLIEWQSQEGKKQLRIKQSISNKWKEVGTLLEIDRALLDGWEKQYLHDSLECCSVVLNYWLNNPCKSYPCTWDGVCRLLDNVQFGQVAEELRSAKCVL